MKRFYIIATLILTFASLWSCGNETPLTVFFKDKAEQSSYNHADFWSSSSAEIFKRSSSALFVENSSSSTLNTELSSSSFESIEDSSSSLDLLSSSSTAQGESSSSAELSSSSGIMSGTFTDERDGEIYKYVQIDNRIWMAENLRYLPQVDGTDISEYYPKYYVYNYIGKNLDTAKVNSNYLIYGVLYNWYAAEKACPKDWRLSTFADWYALNSYLSPDAGQKLKATRGWLDNGNGTDDFGFGALPGGIAIGDSFVSATKSGYWWTSATVGYEYLAYYRFIHYDDQSIKIDLTNKAAAFSVRCVRDAEVVEEDGD